MLLTETNNKFDTQMFYKHLYTIHMHRRDCEIYILFLNSIDGATQTFYFVHIDVLAKM